MKAKPQNYKVAATITVHRIATMTDKGREQVAQWLEQFARDIRKQPLAFSKTFKGRFCFIDNGKKGESAND